MSGTWSPLEGRSRRADARASRRRVRMHQFVVTFQDPLLGRAAREALVELLGISRDDERIVVSPAGGVLLVEVFPEELAAVRRRLASLGAIVLSERVTRGPAERPGEAATRAPAHAEPTGHRREAAKAAEADGAAEAEAAETGAVEAEDTPARTVRSARWTAVT